MNSEADSHILQLSEIFRLMGDSTRLKIIVACLAGPRAVAEIAAETGASPSLVSHHLRLLRAARILRKARQGKQAFYSPADEHISHMLVDMLHHVGEPDDEHEQED
ncbi:MAG TPA: metalloregulator ArsR/SmtB family transcription factor [Alphaproteobacteria bacterium]|jgi:DNA-binding transcriptional ArsR family regulator